MASTISNHNAIDADIAGPGVIIGFMLNNALTVSASLLAIYMRRKIDNTERRKVLGLYPADWFRVLENFVLDLGDQQLLTGVILIIISMSKFYNSSVHLGHNELWTAGDIIVFSSATHGATLTITRDQFKKHPTGAVLRVMLMVITYILWLIIAANSVFSPKPTDSPKLSSGLTTFWHVADCVEAIGILWMYFVILIPLLWCSFTKKARSKLARLAPPSEFMHLLESWEEQNSPRLCSESYKSVKVDEMLRPGFSEIRSPEPLTYPAERTSGTQRQHSRLDISRHARHFCYFYIKHYNSLWTRCAIWVLAEILWPWATAWLLVGSLWLFGFGVMIVNLVQNHTAGLWSFGQMLPPALILLPIWQLATDISDARHKDPKHVNQLPLPPKGDNLRPYGAQFRRAPSITITTYPVDTNHESHRVWPK